MKEVINMTNTMHKELKTIERKATKTVGVIQAFHQELGKNLVKAYEDKVEFMPIHLYHKRDPERIDTLKMLLEDLYELVNGLDKRGLPELAVRRLNDVTNEINMLDRELQVLEEKC